MNTSLHCSNVFASFTIEHGPILFWMNIFLLQFRTKHVFRVFSLTRTACIFRVCVNTGLIQNFFSIHLQTKTSERQNYSDAAGINVAVSLYLLRRTHAQFRYSLFLSRIRWILGKKNEFSIDKNKKCAILSTVRRQTWQIYSQVNVKYALLFFLCCHFWFHQHVLYTVYL